MSEYQYYGWQLIDGHLTEQQLNEVGRLSSHMDEVSPNRAVVTYQWGDFKHKPLDVLLKYFDVFVYDSNFGYRRLAFRIPKKLLDPRAIESYLDDETIRLETRGAYHLLELTCNDEDNDLEYVDSDDMLNRLSTLREQIIQGDFRSLHIAWLASIELEEGAPDHDEALELPPPPGLNKLDSGLRALAEFFAVDLNLIAAAVGPAPSAESKPLVSAIPSLTRDEMESHLINIVIGEAGAVALLKKQLAQKLGNVKPTSASLRTLSDLFRQRDKISGQKQAQARREAERKRIQRLEQLHATQEQTWAQVEALCQEKRGNAYKDATQLLTDLYELGEYKNQQAQFKQRFALILEKYGKSQAFRERLKQAGLR